MGKQKTTDWHQGSVKPVRVGLYQKLVGEQIFWSWWNGSRWGSIGGDAEDAYKHRNVRSLFWNYPWRGLKRRPK